MNKSKRVSVATAASLFEGKICTSESLVFFISRDLLVYLWVMFNREN